jgi:hypothetical protein
LYLELLEGKSKFLLTLMYFDLGHKEAEARRITSSSLENTSRLCIKHLFATPPPKKIHMALTEEELLFLYH